MGESHSAEPPVRSSDLSSYLGSFTLRWALLFGFGAILVLWFLSTYSLVRRLSEVERRAAAISTRFTAGEELLFAVNRQVFLSSVSLRDAFLDGGPVVTPSDREELERSRREIDATLQRYLPDVDSGIERRRWNRLQAELADYWTTMLPALMGQIAEHDAETFLRGEVIPKRETIMRISREIRSLHHDALEQRQAEIARLHAALRRRIWWISGSTLALGLAVAVLVSWYAGRLELRIRRQHVRERQHKTDLQRLSAKLVRAQEEERRRIARDLHDEIGQALMTIKLDLGSLERSSHLSSTSADLLGQARSTADRAMHTVRDLSRLLHPPMLDDFGLPETLRWYLRSFSRVTGIETDLVLHRMEARLSPEVELAVYRIVQEALTNAAKHAHAGSCRVSLQRFPSSLSITIEDDGQGIDPERFRDGSMPSGLGLLGIRERIAGFGGTFGVEGSGGEGTCLTIDLPVHATADEDSGQTLEADNASPPEALNEASDGHTAHPAR